jgi:hypothetical protein
MLKTNKIANSTAAFKIKTIRPISYYLYQTITSA